MWCSKFRAIIRPDNDIDEDELRCLIFLFSCCLILWVLNFYTDHHIEGVMHDRGRRLWFDVAEVPDDNYLMMAELRLYQNPTHEKWRETALDLDGHQQHYQITVYVIVENEDTQEPDLEMLSAINTTNDYHGWLELNVTEGFSAWIQKSRLPNHGFYLTLHNIRQPLELLKFDEIGLIHPRDHEEYQPFMIGFFRGPEVGNGITFKLLNLLIPIYNYKILVKVVEKTKTSQSEKTQHTSKAT